MFDACAANGVAVEINASPQRLDLSDVHTLAARHKGLTVVIDTDAHSTAAPGVHALRREQARAPGSVPMRCLNTRTLDEVRRFLAKEG